MSTRLNDSRGFTLVELVMAIAVGLVLLAAVWTAVWSGQRSSVGIERKVLTTQDARAALEIVASEIRMASFNALDAKNMWRDPANCGISGNQNYKGIQVASDTELIIEMDMATPDPTAGNPPIPNPNGTCGDTPGEIIRYQYDAPNMRLNREVISCATATGGRSALALLSFLGPIAGQPEVRTVEVVNGAVPVFRYFDGKGTQIAYANLPNEIPRIRRIEIVLLVRSADVDPSTGQRRQMAYSTSVIPRNHGIHF
jgi:prepilin-type N-terminal cleavage/methylation domain-containing protein